MQQDAPHIKDNSLRYTAALTMMDGAPSTMLYYIAVPPPSSCMHRRVDGQKQSIHVFLAHMNMDMNRVHYQAHIQRQDSTLDRQNVAVSEAADDVVSISWPAIFSEPKKSPAFSPWTTSTSSRIV